MLGSPVNRQTLPLRAGEVTGSPGKHHLPGKPPAHLARLRPGRRTRSRLPSPPDAGIKSVYTLLKHSGKAIKWPYNGRQMRSDPGAVTWPASRHQGGHQAGRRIGRRPDVAGGSASAGRRPLASRTSPAMSLVSLASPTCRWHHRHPHRLAFVERHFRSFDQVPRTGLICGASSCSASGRDSHHRRKSGLCGRKRRTPEDRNRKWDLWPFFSTVDDPGERRSPAPSGSGKRRVSVGARFVKNPRYLGEFPAFCRVRREHFSCGQTMICNLEGVSNE